VVIVKKLSLLAVGAVGYVLGTRAGRERYEQIRRQAKKVWNTPPVQDAVDDVEEVVRHTASDVGSKVAGVASEARSKVTERIKGDEDGHGPTPVASDYTGPAPAPTYPSVTDSETVFPEDR
jgi:hypothetical protein